MRTLGRCAFVSALLLVGGGIQAQTLRVELEAREEAFKALVTAADALIHLIEIQKAEGRSQEARATVADLDIVVAVLESQWDEMAKRQLALAGSARAFLSEGSAAKARRYLDDLEILEGYLERVEVELIRLRTTHDALAAPKPSEGGETGGKATGGRKKLPVRIEKSVANGLIWLARHQSPDGSWDCDGFMEMDKVSPVCDGQGNALYDVGVTGLALLAFMGLGDIGEGSPHQGVVPKGLKWLRTMQDPEGCFGSRTTNHFTYYHAIGALAMVKAYALTNSIFYKRSAQSAIDFVHKCQNPYLAWRYGVRPRENDTSVSGWMIMALKSAQAAGLHVDAAGFEGMAAWLDKVTEPSDGRVGYKARGSGLARPMDLMDTFPVDKSESLTAVGILSRVFVGEDPRKSEIIQKGTVLCLKTLPVWNEGSGSIDMYYWYYGSNALFQVGGSAWVKWEKALRRALLGNQKKKPPNHAGSWDPIGPWGRDGGRIYSTAICILALETPCRYARVFED